MAAADHKNALPVGYRLNEYEVESLLGHGGFGITYKAQDTSLGSWVAIKEYLPQELALREGGDTVVPKSEADAGSYQWGLERFLDEARILAQFKHNNIVRVLRYLEANGTAYLVMDFEAGQSLGDYLAQVKQPLDEVAIRDIFLPIMDGLREVHTAGLLHRDIKPGNIYLRENGAPMLIDFGAARTALGERSKSLSVLVTPGYAPAEQYSSRAKQSPATDIYALGATMYRCLTGEVPIEASERQTTIFSDQEPDPLPSARSVGEGRYSDQLLASIDWALQIRAQDRPQTVREFQLAVQGRAEVEPNTDAPVAPDYRPSSGPVTPAPASGRGVRRPWKPLLAATLSLALLIPAGWYGWHLLVASTQAVARCDALAASDGDVRAVVAGLPFKDVDSDAAIPACATAVEHEPDNARLWAQYGRALDAGKQYAEAVQAYERALELQPDYVLAQGNLAMKHFRGDGVPESVETALPLLRKAAAAGLPLSMSVLGWMYQHGEGVEPDLDEAMKWTRAAADKGESAAQYRLGRAYQTGEGAEQNWQQALHWYRQSAQQGHAGAQNNVGWLYQNGHGTEVDNDKAFYWFQKAAETGQINAQSNLADMYADGVGVAKDQAKALYWYRKAAEQGSGRDMNITGLMYENGEGVAADDGEAAAWFRKSAEAGYDYGRYNLARMYETGRGVKQDYGEARRLYRIAADNDLAEAQLNLGWMYYEGKGGKRSDSEAYRWTRKAADAGLAQAQVNLGALYAEGRGVRQSERQALNWLKKAARNGHKGAQGALRELGQRW